MGTSPGKAVVGPFPACVVRGVVRRVPIAHPHNSGRAAGNGERKVEDAVVHMVMGSWGHSVSIIGAWR